MSERTARKLFLVAAVYGFLVLVPLFFLEARLAPNGAFQNPDQYYGFLGTAVAWQFAFLVIARNPVRFRPVMLAAAAEKLLPAAASVALFLLGRIDVWPLIPGGVDVLLGCLFLWAHTSLRGRAP